MSTEVLIAFIVKNMPANIPVKAVNTMKRDVQNAYKSLQLYRYGAAKMIIQGVHGNPC